MRKVCCILVAFVPAFFSFLSPARTVAISRGSSQTSCTSYCEPAQWPRAAGTDIIPSKTVLLYPEGQASGKGIVENGVPVTSGARQSNGLTGPETCNWKGSLANVGDFARMDFYFPSKPNGQLVIVCPGGSYTHLSSFNEGVYVAEWLVARGITACVLKYRMPNGHKTVVIDDVQNAFRYCRYHSSEWGIDRVGVMGFSAGGHLASAASVFFVDEVTRPDFAVLIYPRIAQQAGAHSITMDEMIGRPEEWKDAIASDASKKIEYEHLQRWFDTYHFVTPDTPPTFIAQSADDNQVSALNFIEYYKALIECSVPVEVHVYPEGGHGWGFGDTRYKGPGTDRFATFRELFYSELSIWLSRHQGGGWSKAAASVEE